MKIIDCHQGSEAWKQARCGSVTASRMSDLLATIKSGEAAARRDLKFQLVGERLSGRPQDDGYINAEMQFGLDNEQFARSSYECAQGVLVDTVGLVQHPTIEMAAASPDGIVGSDGLVEIKAPKIATHLNYLMAGVVPAKYKPQMLFQMACCERAWCDFASYRPDLPEHLQLFVVRLPRDDAAIKIIEAEVRKLLSEVDEIIERLKA